MLGRALLLALCATQATGAEHKLNAYDRHYLAKTKYKVGEWVPPAPPSKEASLEGNVPIPSSIGLANNFNFVQGGRSAFKSGSKTRGQAGGMRRLLQAESPMGSKVPHNWFGQGQFQAPIYEIATGIEECNLCKLMLQTGRVIVDNSYTTSEGAETAEVEAMGLAPGKKNLCTHVDLKYREMCKGYIKYMIDCPSFVHNICHEDMGGSERLRAPCPDYLKCYYCLRINPLYCISTDGLI